MKSMLRCLVLQLLVLCSYNTFSQSVVLQGKITEAEGPVSGATVTIKGTSKAVAAADDGSFSLSYTGRTVLVISAAGYEPQELQVTGQRSVNIQLIKNSRAMEEVLVTAYGTSKKSTFTGSASVVSGEKLQKIQSTNVTQSLQGMTPGVQVLNTNGQPGTDGTILIRGMSSMRGDDGPLFVVDGMPYAGALSAINQNDIESMTVLKDAAATSLYGSRAANGVIVITTKKGKTAKAQINVRSTFGFSDFAVMFPDKLNAKQIFEVSWEAIRNGQTDQGMGADAAAQYATNNLTGKFFQNINIGVFNDPYPVGTDGKFKPAVKQLYAGDWYGEMFSKRLRQEHSVDISGATGANNKTQYYLSGSYLEDNGNVTVQKFNRYSARLNVSSEVKPWLQVGSNISFAHSFQQYPFVGTRFVRVMPEVYSVYEWDYAKNEYKRDVNGNLIPDFGDATRTEWRGWNTRFAGDYKNNDNWSFSGFLYDNFTSRNFAEIKFSPSLKLRTSLSTDFGLNYDHSYASNTIGNSIGTGGSASRNANRMFSYTMNHILTFDKSFGEHHVSILGGQEVYKYKYNALGASRRGFPLPGLYEISGASTLTGATSSEDNYRLESYLSKAEYSFGQRYYLSGSFRKDGSSRFHPDTRWGNFWSVGGSWRLSKEAFLSGLTWADNIKLRASYGTTGNDKVSYYAYQGLYATGYNFMDLAGALLSRLPTPNLKWESNVQVDIGLDFRLFNRIDGSVDWFNRKSKDLIFNRPLPPSTGNSGIDENIGDVKNYGWEVQLASNIIRTSKFSWDVDVNASSYKNRIVRLPQKEVITGRYKWTEGVSRYEFYGPVWAGVNPETGNNSWWKFGADGKKERTELYNEVNRNDQMRYLGSSIPDLFGSITNTFNYSGFSLSVMLYTSIGGNMYDGDYVEGVRWRRGFNLSTQILDRWTPENRNTKIPRISEFTQNNVSVYSSQYLFNNTFTRLRNVSLGYMLPAGLTRRYGISSLRVFALGTNLYTWGPAARRGTDPETTINGAVGDGANGSGAAPITKSYTLGIQLSL